MQFVSIQIYYEYLFLRFLLKYVYIKIPGTKNDSKRRRSVRPFLSSRKPKEREKKKEKRKKEALDSQNPQRRGKKRRRYQMIFDGSLYSQFINLPCHSLIDNSNYNRVSLRNSGRRADYTCTCTTATSLFIIVGLSVCPLPSSSSD